MPETPSSENRKDRAHTDDQAAEYPEVIYGEIDDGLVFVRASLARRLATLYELVRSQPRTWQDVRDRVDDELWEDLRSRRDIYEVTHSTGALEEPFDPESLAGYRDGLWHPWPAREMLDLLPNDLVAGYGQVTDTLLDGRYLHIPLESEAGLVAELRQRGWRCERDDGLVLEASRYE